MTSSAFHPMISPIRPITIRAIKFVILRQKICGMDWSDRPRLSG